MPGFTSPDNIEYPVAGDNVAPLNVVFQDMADSMQTALSVREVYSYRWVNSAARAAETGMRNGDLGYQIDTDTSYRYTGSAWKIWDLPGRAYTPTFGGVTVGNGTSSFRYWCSAGTLYVQGVFTLGSTSAVTGEITVSNPISIVLQGGVGNPIGGAIFTDVSPVNVYSGQSLLGTAGTNARIRPINSASTYGISAVASATIPFTWTAGDNFSVQYSGEIT